MKRLGLLLVLLVILRVAAQDDALLLYIVQENDIATIYVSNVTTGEQTKVAELLDPGGPSWEDAGWSSDGRYVWAVDSLSEDTRRLRFFDPVDWSEAVIAENLMMAGCDASIYWAPDGQSLAYYTGVVPDYQAALLNLSSDLTYIFDDPQNPEGMPLYFSPDGRYLSVIAGGNLLIDTADGTVTTIAGRIDQFSLDGRFLLYYDLRNNAWLYTIATGEAVDLKTPALIEQWSPDGRYLVMRDYGEQDMVNYFYYDVQAGSFMPLDVGKHIYRIVDWMHDGAELLVQTSEADGSEQSLVRYAMASGEIATLIEAPGIVWNIRPNGDWLAASYNFGHQEGEYPPGHIWIADGDRVALDTEIVLSGPFAPWAADFMDEIMWSPDGRWLIMRAADGIYRFDTETTVLDRIPADAFGYGELGWSGDSRYLLIRIFPEDYNQGEWMIWNNEDEVLTPTSYPMDALIGWRYSDAHNSLIYCGIG